MDHSTEYNTIIPKVCVRVRSGGVVTVARGRMGDVPGGTVVREEGDGYGGHAVGNWGVIGCTCDDKRGLDET